MRMKLFVTRLKVKSRVPYLKAPRMISAIATGLRRTASSTWNVAGSRRGARGSEAGASITAGKAQCVLLPGLQPG